MRSQLRYQEFGMRIIERSIFGIGNVLLKKPLGLPSNPQSWSRPILNLKL